MLCQRFSLCPESPTSSTPHGQCSGHSELLHPQERSLRERNGRPSGRSPETGGTGNNTDQKMGNLIFDLDFVAEIRM